jgi:hypothetical protein
MLAVALCTCNITLWHVRLSIFSPENVTMPSHSIVVGVDVAVKYIKVFNVAMVMYILHCCRATIYSTVRSQRLRYVDLVVSIQARGQHFQHLL